MQASPDPYAQTAYQPAQASPQAQPLPSDFMTVLIFAALTILLAPIFAPILWWLSSRELRRIEVGIAASERTTELKIFRVVGIVLTVLFILGVAGGLLLFGISALMVALMAA